MYKNLVSLMPLAVAWCRDVETIVIIWTIMHVHDRPMTIVYISVMQTYHTLFPHITILNTNYYQYYVEKFVQHLIQSYTIINYRSYYRYYILRNI